MFLANDLSFYPPPPHPHPLPRGEREKIFPPQMSNTVGNNHPGQACAMGKGHFADGGDLRAQLQTGQA